MFRAYTFRGARSLTSRTTMQSRTTDHGMALTRGNQIGHVGRVRCSDGLARSRPLSFMLPLRCTRNQVACSRRIRFRCVPANSAAHTLDLMRHDSRGGAQAHGQGPDPRAGRGQSGARAVPRDRPGQGVGLHELGACTRLLAIIVGNSAPC